MITTRSIKHWLGFTLFIVVISFSFYKSSVEEFELDNYKNSAENMQRLQIQLHRDLLNYRGSSVYEYDTLNNTHRALLSAAQLLYDSSKSDKHKKLASILEKLESSLVIQQEIIEDFKQHHSILQNSMSYYSRLSTKFYNKNNKEQGISAETLGNLSSLIMQYTRKPVHETALKLFAALDKINVNPSSEVRTLINHSLLIVERLPEIDANIAQFYQLDIEGQIQRVLRNINDMHEVHSNNAILYNALMLLFSLGLLSYVIYMFIALQRNRNTLSNANLQLNKEVNERTRTENTLLKFVTHCTQDYTDDNVHCILNALCRSLKVRYAQIITLNTNSSTGASASIIDNYHYSQNIPANVVDTADEDALARGRLVYNDELQQYFPATRNSLLAHAVSYIGITLKSSETTKRLLVIADDKPIDNISLYENILSLAAGRMSIELHREDAMQDAIRYQRGLERIDSWVARLITCGQDKTAFIDTASMAVQDISKASLTALCEVTPERDSYIYAAVSGDKGDILLGERHMLDDGGLCAWTINKNEMVCVNDLHNDIRSIRKLICELNVEHAMLAPIMLGDEVYGCLVAFRNDQNFDDIDQQLLSQFCQSMKMALTNKALLGDIQSEKERAEITLHSIADAVITTNALGNIEYMNHAAEYLCGWDVDSVTGKPVQNVFRIVDNETQEPQHNLADSCLQDGIAISKSMTTLITRDDSEREIECSMSPIKTSTNVTDGIVIVFHDETERRRMENMIRHQASHDALTGLVNRNEFSRLLNEHIFDARDTGHLHVLCYLDLDRFKLVNDTAGHTAGDEILVQATRIIQSCIRGGDILGRLGGDEFGIILQNCSIDSAQHITQKIVDKIYDYKLEWEDEILTIGVSIGLTTIDNETMNAVEATKQADIACYTAKDHGRSRIYVYQRKDTELLRKEEETRWASKISEAFAKDRFKLYAQPICPLNNNNGDIMHLEVLVRMLDNEGNLIAPGAFIPAAERYNLMASVDRHIIRKTFDHIVSRPADENICYSINLSGNSLSDDNLSEFISGLITQYNIDPARLCFEVTETAAITNLVNARHLISEIRKIGCCIALDDFGSGLSSFEYLKNLPVDYLKIDGSFVRDMATNKIDQAMVAAINQVGHVMNIKTIAEFVENEQIITSLQRLDVDFAQGYGISRPVPIEDISFKQLSGHYELISRRASGAG
ncbi:MAG: EAL domain-containing protein [Gammaproteobacteria bacterium]